MRYATYHNVERMVKALLKKNHGKKVASDVVTDVKNVCAIMDSFLNAKDAEKKLTSFQADTVNGCLIMSMDLLYGLVGEQYDNSATNFATLLRICDHMTIKELNSDVVRFTVMIEIA